MGDVSPGAAGEVSSGGGKGTAVGQVGMPELADTALVLSGAEQRLREGDIRTARTAAPAARRFPATTTAGNNR